jgi:hypothetical protein
MASPYSDWIETAATLKGVAERFEEDLRAGLKAELMRLAEERVDALVDETVKGLQARVDGMKDMAMMQSLIQITIKRESRDASPTEPAPRA